MADLLSFLPLIGKQPIFGQSLFGPPEAAPAPDAFNAPEHTTVAGMPLSPLLTGGLGALLFSQLARKGFGRQAALQGGLLGYNLANAPLQQEQQQYNKMMEQAINKDLLTPYVAPTPQPLANQAQWSAAAPDAVAGQVPAVAAPIATTPPAPPAIRYGGMTFMPTPTVDYGALFPGVPGVAGIRGRATPDAIASAGTLGLAQSQEQRAAAEAARLDTERQGVRETARAMGVTDWETKPIALLLEDLKFKTRLGQAPLLVQAYAKMREELPKVGEFEQAQFGMSPEGVPTWSITQPPEAMTKEAIRARQAAEENRRLEVQYRTAQLDYWKNKAAATETLSKFQNSPGYLKAKLTLEGLDKQFDNLIKMQSRYVNSTTGEIIDPVKYNAIGIKMAELSDSMTQTTNEFATLVGQQPGQTATTTTATTTATPQVTGEQKAQAEKVKPLLDQFYASTGQLPLYNQANKDLYPDASTIYYATTDPAVDMIKREMAGKYSWQMSNQFITDLKTKFGEQVANAAIQRWRYNR